MITNLSRRDFLMSTAGVTAMSMSAKSYSQILGANERIAVGLVGAGGMGTNHIEAFLNLKQSNNLNMIAVADCWMKRAEESATKVGAPHALQDYRKLLDIKEIDYVTIATPEHRHAQMALDALDAGKHLYCEKPLTHTIPEAFQVLDKAKQSGLALQVGVQGMCDDSYSSAADSIRGGLLGRVVQAQIEYVRRYDEQGYNRVWGLDDKMPQPADLNWDMWLGSAPKAPWNPRHYFEWRNYAAYSGGIATDLFIHRLSRIMRACNLMYPRRVVGMGGIWHWPDGRDLPDNFEMLCEYPRGMTVHVLGTMSNRHPIEHCIRGYRGTMIFNDEGWIAKNKDGETLADYKKSGAEDIKLHHGNLHNHLRNGEVLKCPVEFAVAGLVAVLMAVESWRTGRMMAWDDAKRDMVPADTVPLDPFPDDPATES
ncbi:MAG: Gfo/Idh/MocA family oxidoreductase [Pirellulales bacterium]